MHDPQHLVPRRRAESVKAVLHRALHAHGMARRLPRRIAPATWERAVGVQIAARAQPTVVSGGVLHVLVQDHRWRDQLDAARNFLLERINRTVGGVREIQFGLAHTGALDHGRRRAGIGAITPPPQMAIEPREVLGEARLEPSLREALQELRELSAAQKLALILSRRRGEHVSERAEYPVVERPYRMEEVVDAMRLALLRRRS